MKPARSSGSRREDAGKQAGQAPVRARAESPVVWPAWVPTVVLALLTVFFFQAVLNPFSGSRCWLWEDFLYFSYPNRFFAATSLAQGIFPFWNPYVFGGMPFFADIQTAVLYPFNLVQALLVSGGRLDAYYVELFTVLHFFLAGWFTFRFLRLSGLDRESSLIGGVTFAFSGFMVTHVIHLNFISVFIWLPLVLELFERALSSGRLRYAAGCSLVLAVSTLGGYPQYSLFIFYSLALYWLIQELERRKAPGWTARRALVRLSLLAGVAAAGLGLNAFNYLPAAELAQYTPRSSMTYAASVEHSLQPLFLFKLLCPTFFGVQLPEFNSYWAGGYGSFWETCLFVGVLPLVLALLALRGLRTDRQVRFAAVLALLGLVLALGQYGFLYKAFFYLAPGFGRFRIPGRFSALATFGLALLAAHGWAYLRGQAGGEGKATAVRGVLLIAGGAFVATAVLLAALQSGALDRLAGSGPAAGTFKLTAAGAGLRSLVWIVAAAVLLAAAGSRKLSRAGWLGPAALIFIFTELYLFGSPFIQGKVSPDELYPRTDLVRKLQEEGKTEYFRVNARSEEYPTIMVLRRNQGSLDNLFLLEGYNPLQLKRRLNEVEQSRRFDLLNVKYMIQVDFARRSAGLAGRATYLPRAFMVHRWRVIDRDEAILATLNDSTFDYRSEAILDAEPGIDMPAAQEHIESKVDIIRYTPNEIQVQVVNEKSGLLMLSEWDYPGWKAWVDGEESKVFRTDNALRSVAVGSGRHVIRFSYQSDTFLVGLLASLATLAVMLAGVLIAARRGKF
jgi:hypothetical protein